MSNEQCVAIIAAILRSSYVIAKEIYVKDDDSATWDIGEISVYVAEARKYRSGLSVRPRSDPSRGGEGAGQ